MISNLRSDSHNYIAEKKMSSSSQLSRDTESPLLALQLQHRGSGQWQLSAALFQRVAASIDPTVELAGDKSIFVLRLFEFMDNQQFSALDSFLTQIGGENCQLLVAEDFGADLAKASSLSKKISLLLECKGMQPTFVKKNMFAAKPDTMTLLQRLCGQHVMSKVETDFPRCLPCVECVFSTSRYRDMEGNTEVQVELGSMERFMRLDSAAADAVNLLPKADHPSVFGSLFGVLNRCKTKLGSRTLERWLRQPLLDITEINQRLNVVQLFTEQSVLRDQLRDGPLKAIPDLEAVANK